MTVRVHLNQCVECGCQTSARDMLCNECAPMYADDPCDCPVCRSDPGRAGIVPCAKGAADATLS